MIFINAFQKFKNNYEHLFNTKFDLDIIKEKYGFNEQYLTKLKYDLDFLKNSAINILYHFSVILFYYVYLTFVGIFMIEKNINKYRYLKKYYR